MKVIVTESGWQIQMRKWDGLQKKREKEYTDKKRLATDLDIEVGDKVVLKEGRQNKLSTNFELQQSYSEWGQRSEDEECRACEEATVTLFSIWSRQIRVTRKHGQRFP